jgi:hypothetical protein
VIVQTKFGEVSTREVSDFNGRKHYVILKDNPKLKSLLQWLEHSNFKTSEDLNKRCRLKEVYEQIKNNTSVKFFIKPQVNGVVFYTLSKSDGGFSEGIRDYINIFYNMLYYPGGLYS